MINRISFLHDYKIQAVGGKFHCTRQTYILNNCIVCYPKRINLLQKGLQSQKRIFPEQTFISNDKTEYAKYFFFNFL